MCECERDFGLTRVQDVELYPQTMPSLCHHPPKLATAKHADTTVVHFSYSRVV